MREARQGGHAEGEPAVNAPFPYEGPPELQQTIVDALTRVVDPEVALSIVDVGLVYGVKVGRDTAHVRMTMTSAACPVADLIVEEAETELDQVLPPQYAIHVELCWEPAWGPERMSERARRFMQG
ncbi:MAG: metal-sulfur cluster assembly factor [Rhizobacter sp.]|nr:metal-sulfur cluster assembly factor [Rhizobacter sp.]